MYGFQITLSPDDIKENKDTALIENFRDFRRIKGTGCRLFLASFKLEPHSESTTYFFPRDEASIPRGLIAKYEAVEFGLEDRHKISNIAVGTNSDVGFWFDKRSQPERAALKITLPASEILSTNEPQVLRTVTILSEHEMAGKDIR